MKTSNSLAQLFWNNGMERRYTVAIRALAILGVLVAAYLAATLPLGIEEAALWDNLIRPPLRDAFRAPTAWSGLFYATLAERSIGLFRLSILSLRLPAILAGAVVAFVVWRAQRPIVVVAYVVGLAAGWFSTAQGVGVALTLWALSVCLPAHAGWLFGLAIAASPMVAPLGLIYWRIKDIERVLIPAAVVAFILLIIPASHAGPADGQDSRADFHREANRRNAARGGAFQPPP
jgi:hypothetical protein